MTQASKIYDAVICTSGEEDYNTIQEAIDADCRVIYVRCGTYAGFTQDQAQSKIIVEPGSVITSDCILNAANCAFVVGSGTDIQGLVDVYGQGCYIRFENGCTLVGIDLNTTADYTYTNGGGHGTVIDGGTTRTAYESGGHSAIVENIAAKTTAGSGNSYDAFSAVGSGCTQQVFRLCKVIDSDDDGFVLLHSDHLVLGCNILGADSEGIVTGTADDRCRLIGNYITDVADDGIDLSGANDCVVVGNVINNATSNVVEIVSGEDNHVVVGNRTDGSISDSSGTSTVSNNDETAF